MLTKAYFLLAALSCSLASTMAFVPFHSTVGLKKITLSSYPSFLLNKQATVKPALSKTSTSSLLAQKTELDSSSTSIGPSAVFLAFAAALGKLCLEIQGSNLPTTIGTTALLIVSAAVAYDNLIIGLGANVFADARTDDKVYQTLKLLSYPRFILHALGVPFLYVTTAEIGKAAGLEWLQGDLVQTGILVAAAAIAIISRVNFFKNPEIVIANTDEVAEDNPEDSLQRQLLWFTYENPIFLYVVPSIVLALFNLVTGFQMFKLDAADPHAAGIWLMVSAVTVVSGSSKPDYVMRFTGNLGEVVMLWCMFEAATLVL